MIGPPPSVDVVIPTYNGWSLTASCLAHLSDQTVSHRVIVVDNGSTDGTPASVARDYPEVVLRVLGANRGFAAACNAGVAAGAGEIVVLLNNDVDAAPTFLEYAIAPFARHPQAGSVAPLLVRPGGAVIDSVGPTADATLAGFPRLQGLPMTVAHTSNPRLLGPSGGAGAYRRSAWDDVGGMDDRIFMYHEDLDLALRLRARGWEAVTAPLAVAEHHGSASIGRRSALQRERAGFGRGYVLGRYGVLRRRSALRALATETLVAAADAALARDAAALRGRISGWLAAAAPRACRFRTTPLIPPLAA